MPKKKHKETSEQQGARFRAEVERMIAAGELSSIEADERLERALSLVTLSGESPARS